MPVLKRSYLPMNHHYHHHVLRLRFHLLVRRGYDFQFQANTSEVNLSESTVIRRHLAPFPSLAGRAHEVAALLHERGLVP